MPSKSTSSIRSSKISTVTVAIDARENGEISGRFCNRFDCKVYTFHSVLELLSSLDSLFDHYGYPEATHQYRQFSSKKQVAKVVPPEEGESAMGEEIVMEGGGKATFIVHVQFRQNVNWQGSIQWVESKKEQKFRSTLELIKLMDEALDTVSGDDNIKWEDPRE